MSYFSRQELLQGRDAQYPLTPEMEKNLAELTRVLNLVRAAYGSAMLVNSGYRPAAVNASVGGAKASAHMMCQAVDIEDKDGKLAEWAMNNLTLLESCGIFMEDPRYTYIVDKQGNRCGGWCHLDIRGPKSGKRVFIPYAGPIKLQVRG